MRARRRRRFPLVESVVVAAVLGALAIAGLPRVHAALRDRRALEAVATMAVIERALLDHRDRNGQYPAGGGAWNPPAGATLPAAMDPTLPGWSALSLPPRAAGHYRYEWTTWPDASGRFTRVVVHARGDTDGDGVFLDHVRTFENGAWVSETRIDE